MKPGTCVSISKSNTTIFFSVTITTVICICLPAQNYKDVTELLRYVILYDYSYTQKMSTNIRINAVRQSIQTKHFNPFICWSVPTETSSKYNYGLNSINISFLQHITQVKMHYSIHKRVSLIFGLYI